MLFVTSKSQTTPKFTNSFQFIKWYHLLSISMCIFRCRPWELDAWQIRWVEAFHEGAMHPLWLHLKGFCECESKYTYYIYIYMLLDTYIYIYTVNVNRNRNSTNGNDTGWIWPVNIWRLNRNDYEYAHQWCWNALGVFATVRTRNAVACSFCTFCKNLLHSFCHMRWPSPTQHAPVWVQRES